VLVYTCLRLGDLGCVGDIWVYIVNGFFQECVLRGFQAQNPYVAPNAYSLADIARETSCVLLKPIGTAMEGEIEWWTENASELQIALAGNEDYQTNGAFPTLLTTPVMSDLSDDQVKGATPNLQAAFHQQNMLSSKSPILKEAIIHSNNVVQAITPLLQLIARYVLVLD